MVLGFSFKENCSDIRNTKIIDLIRELNEFGLDVDCYDPLVNKQDVVDHYEYNLLDVPKDRSYDAIIIAVSHDFFRDLGINSIRKWGNKGNLVFDLKYLFPAKLTDLRL